MTNIHFSGYTYLKMSKGSLDSTSRLGEVQQLQSQQEDFIDNSKVIFLVFYLLFQNEERIQIVFSF